MGYSIGLDKRESSGIETMNELKTIPPIEYLDELTPDELGLLIIEELGYDHPDRKFIRALVDAGANLNTPKKGYRAIHIAVGNNRIDIAILLIAAGAPLDIKDGRRGRTPLHRAAIENCLEIAQALIAAGAPLDAQDNPGRTALHYAARYGHLGIAQLLITAGASIDIRDADDFTPWDQAMGILRTECPELKP